MKENKKFTLSRLLALILTGMLTFGSIGLPIYAVDDDLEDDVPVEEVEDDSWRIRNLFSQISSEIVWSDGRQNRYGIEFSVGDSRTATLKVNLPEGIFLDSVRWDYIYCDPEGAVSFSPSGSSCGVTAVKTGQGKISCFFTVYGNDKNGNKVSEEFATDSLFVVVKPKNLNFVFTQCNTEMKVGESQNIVIKQQDESGTHDIYYQDYNPEVISSDPSVVEIITEDVGEKWSVYKFTAKAVSPGTATISIHGFDPTTGGEVDGVPTPSQPKVFQTTTITVKGSGPDSVTLSSHSLEMNVGDTAALYAEILPANADDKTLTWESSDSTVAKVIDGTVIAQKAGTSTITVKTSNGKTDKCTVTVKGKEAESVKLNKDSLEMAVGDTETLTATVKPDDAADKTVTWSSSNNSIVTVKDGKLTANKKGTATITVKTTNGKSATCKVTVKDTEPTGVTVSPSTANVKLGDTVKLSANVTPDKADQTVTWTSSDTSIATVSKDGTVTGKALGTATITAKTANGKTASCKVTVKPVEVSSISLDKTSASAKVGETVSLSVTYNPSNATNKSVSWTTSNSSVATVSNGVVTAKNVGTTTITAKTSNGKTATCQVTVTPIEVDSISLNVTSKELEQGKTLALYATVYPTNASIKTVTWASSNPSVATVDTNGKVTAKNAGTATITATSNNGKTATCKITVPEVSVTSITLSKTSASLDIGESVALTTTITPSNAGNKSVTWAVDDSSVATVDSNGNVKAVGEGKTIVTAKTANGKTAACTITVVDLSNFKFEFLPDTQRIELEETKQLAFTSIPDGISVTFKSKDSSIITVDENGYVTGHKMGLTTVSATVNGVKSVCYVTVSSNKAVRYAARKQFAEEVLYYVNIERQKEGLAPVQLMDDLSYLAQIRTDEQVKVYQANRDLYRTQPFISHTRPDGTPWSTVFEYASIPNVKARAENLIQGAGYTAKTCVKRWMESPGHRANILRPNLTHMGIGVEFVNIKPEGGSTSLCVTQLFIQQGSSK